MLRAARQNARSTRLVQGDLDHLPFRDASIDLLTLSLALHHLPTPRHALPELRRVLRPRGRLVLAAWADELSPLWQAFDRWFERAGLGTARSRRQPDLPINTAGAAARPPCLTSAGSPRPRSRASARRSSSPRWPSSGSGGSRSRQRTRRSWTSTRATHRVDRGMPASRTLAPLVADGEIRADQAVLFAVARP